MFDLEMDSTTNRNPYISYDLQDFTAVFMVLYIIYGK